MGRYATLASIITSNIADYAMMGLGSVQISNLLEIRSKITRLLCCDEAERPNFKLSDKCFKVFLYLLAFVSVVDTGVNAAAVLEIPDSEK